MPVQLIAWHYFRTKTAALKNLSLMKKIILIAVTAFCAAVSANAQVVKKPLML